jgi:hypothetical protein
MMAAKQSHHLCDIKPRPALIEGGTPHELKRHIPAADEFL